MTLIFILFEKNKILATNSINAILRRDIFLSAILPILTVCFVSYLYVVEESNVKKAELIDNLNKQMNDLESREFYYNPLCDYFLKNLHNSNIIQKYLKTIMNAKGEARNIECERLGYYFQEQLTKGKFVSNSLALGKINTFFDLKEIMFIGKDDWIASAFVNDKTVDKSSAFGNIISKIVKTTFYEKNDTHKDNSEKLKDELITEKTLDILSSGYGSDVAIRIINLPNNLIIVSNTFSSLGLYIGCFPNINNPDYIIVALIFMGNDFKPDICNKRNDSIITYKEHLASGSMDNKLFCFYSPNINVGDFFFYDGSYINKREELQTVKELGLVSSWINSSYLPLSKEVNICGTHYLEARQGNFIKDNVYAALGSNYPIKMNFKKKLYFLGIIIIISLIMILIISHIVISDLLFPVRQLITGAIEASKGNYNFRTNFMRKDELGTLCFSFDKMMRGLEEKQLMNSMVSKTALKMTANFSQIGSKKVNVVLLYISIPNFDKLMKNIQPNILFSRLREQIAIISKIVIENGGDIDKIMGEKLLIAFQVNNNSFEELASKVSKIAHFIATNDKLYFNVSVGVNCGQVISGYLGVGEKQDFTIIGDPVNVTARIESLAEKLETNRCLVSENIYRYIKSNVQTKLFGEVELKGKSEPMKVYQLL